jgi:TonB family protein
MAAAAAAASPVRAAGPIRDESAILREEYGLPEKRGGNQNVLIAAGVGALAVVGVVGFLLFGRGGGESSEAAAAPAQPPAQTAPPQPAPQPAQAGLTPEQIQALIDQALAKQRQEIDAGRQASDEQVRALQRQLEEAQRVRAAALAAGTQPAPAPAVESAPVEPMAEAGGAQAPAPLAAPAAPVPTSTLTATPPPAPAASAPKPAADAPAPAPAAARPAPQPSVPAPSAAPPPAPAASGAPAKSGDIVPLGPGVTPPTIVRKPTLNYPPVAQRMRKEAVVTVRVLVDENGRAAEVQLSGPKAGFGMDEAALAYAKSCVFEPAKKGGVKVRVWFDIKVAFKL